MGRIMNIEEIERCFDSFAGWVWWRLNLSRGLHGSVSCDRERINVAMNVATNSTFDFCGSPSRVVGGYGILAWCRKEIDVFGSDIELGIVEYNESSGHQIFPSLRMGSGFGDISRYFRILDKMSFSA